MNKGQTQVVAGVLTSATVLFIGIWVVMDVINSINLPTTAATVTNESVTPTAIDSVIQLGQKSVETILFVANQTYTVPAANYTLTANTTGSFLNFALASNANATNVAYNVSYNYNTTGRGGTIFTNVQTTFWNGLSLLAVGLIVAAAAVILGYFGFGVSKNN